MFYDKTRIVATGTTTRHGFVFSHDPVVRDQPSVVHHRFVSIVSLATVTTLEGLQMSV